MLRNSYNGKAQDVVQYFKKQYFCASAYLSASFKIISEQPYIAKNESLGRMETREIASNNIGT